MLAIHLTGIDRDWRLTKDAFLYDETGRQMAEHWRTNGVSTWPARVNVFYWDCAYEWLLGALYYSLGDSLLLAKLLSVLSGALVPLLFWYVTRLVYGSPRLASRVLMWTALFPSLVYYSCLAVRDAHATVAMGLVFVGVVAITRPAPPWAQLSLPLGLLLMAGLRFYVVFSLLVLIPAACIVSWILSGEKIRFSLRAVYICIVVLIAGGLLNVDVLIEEFAGSRMLDLDFLNHVRDKLNRGSGAMYQRGEAPDIGGNAVDTSKSLFVGLYFFFVSVDPTNMGSIRQWLAIPEVLISVYMLPSVLRGATYSLRRFFRTSAIMIFVTLGITVAYSLIATNAGPLLRWRLQVAAVYIILAAVGWTLKENLTCVSRPRQVPRIRT